MFVYTPAAFTNFFPSMMNYLFPQALLESNVGRVQVEFYKEIKKVAHPVILHEAALFDSTFIALSFLFCISLFFTIDSYISLGSCYSISESNLSPLSV